jgi:hypothetical protein
VMLEGKGRIFDAFILIFCCRHDQPDPFRR